MDGDSLIGREAKKENERDDVSLMGIGCEVKFCWIVFGVVVSLMKLPRVYFFRQIGLTEILGFLEDDIWRRKKKFCHEDESRR